MTESQPTSTREALRSRLVDATPRWYSPELHLALPTLFGLSIAIACFASLPSPTPASFLMIPITYLISNMTEWRAHRDLLHKRHWLAPVLYDRHTPEHHVIFITEDMAMRERREWRLVLIPAYGIFLIFLGIAPTAGLIWWLGFPNAALIHVAMGMIYTLSYEWLHLSYHLSPEHPIGGLAVVRWLRRHHAIHHDPRLMQRYNFNVTVPLWDWIRGTIAPDQAGRADTT